VALTGWRKKALDYLVYLILRTGVMLIQAFPIGVMQMVARGLGNLLYAVDKKHRKRAIENLTQAFGHEWSEHHIRTVARRCCQHMVMLAMEILSLAKIINRNNWYDYVDLRNVEPALRIILDNRGIMLVTGHFGNWEVMGYTIGALGVRSYAVARPIDNPYIERWFLQHREETGQTIINKFGAADLMVKVIQSQQPLCFLADQHAGARGVWVDFFGRKASTYKSIALLAMDQNCPIAVGGAWRIDDRFQFRAEVVDIVDPEDYKDDPDAVIHITERYTKALEKVIRMAPEQYLWMHRRWREPPPPRQKKPKPSAPAASPAPAGPA
jgi:KDO2-lipid IV(A) lauroyltransferase